MEAEINRLRDRVLLFHDEMLRQTGGASGIRDRDVLDVALARPFATFGGEDLYPDMFAKAAALIESLVMNHPFVDGNKRTGLMSGMALLSTNGYEFTATEDERYDFVNEIAKGNLDFDAILKWLQDNSEIELFKH